MNEIIFVDLRSSQACLPAGLVGKQTSEETGVQAGWLADRETGRSSSCRHVFMASSATTRTAAEEGGERN